MQIISLGVSSRHILHTPYFVLPKGAGLSRRMISDLIIFPFASCLTFTQLLLSFFIIQLDEQTGS